MNHPVLVAQFVPGLYDHSKLHNNGAAEAWYYVRRQVIKQSWVINLSMHPCFDASLVFVSHTQMATENLRAYIRHLIRQDVPSNKNSRH
jgi:hypothetical protein